MEMMHMVPGGDGALAHEYDAMYQELQDCVRQGNRLASYQHPTKGQQQELSVVNALIPALVQKLGEIHFQMAQSL